MCSIKQPGIFLLCAVLLSGRLFAQDTAKAKIKDSTEVNVQQKGKYAFVLYAGGGWFNYIGSIGSPGIASNTSVTRSRPSGIFRIMWHPDHRLRFGIESGYVNFYTYTVQNGSTPGKVNLTGIPVMVIWSMAITKRINVFAGAGFYLLTTDLNYKGNVKASSFSLGTNISVNYVHPVTPKLGVGAELKWIDATQTKDYGISAQVLLVWKFLEW